ncbi:MAG: antirestriction protein [Deltaproteobacteria bacterium HGW-Deltaproteobacteria-15]|nr:MAG: antirestriction protein [Deltaproteobacteria bacterium HGW-Deltaproteobacteria-15]
MNGKVKEVLQAILDRFNSGDIPNAVAYSMFPIADTPSSQWSILNRTLMFLAGTHDARGFRQWNEVNRYVKKGSKAFYILVPHIRRRDDKDTGDERDVLIGFLTRAVFRYEDTDGEPLDHEQIDLGGLPLIERAQEWGVEVKAIPGNYRYAGYYSSQRKVIALATMDECVFLHELAHCAHDKIKGGLKSGQDPAQEIVAQLAAQALCRIVGKTGDKHLGTSYRYIEGYAERIKVSPFTACLKVMAETEKVLTLILKGETDTTQVIEKAAA